MNGEKPLVITSAKTKPRRLDTLPLSQLLHLRRFARRPNSSFANFPNYSHLDHSCTAHLGLSVVLGNSRMEQAQEFKPKTVFRRSRGGCGMCRGRKKKCTEDFDGDG